MAGDAAVRLLDQLRVAYCQRQQLLEVLGLECRVGKGPRVQRFLMLGILFLVTDPAARRGLVLGVFRGRGNLQGRSRPRGERADTERAQQSDGQGAARAPREARGASVSAGSRIRIATGAPCDCSHRPKYSTDQGHAGSTGIVMEKVLP